MAGRYLLSDQPTGADFDSLPENQMPALGTRRGGSRFVDEPNEQSGGYYPDFSQPDPNPAWPASPSIRVRAAAPPPPAPPVQPDYESTQPLIAPASSYYAAGSPQQTALGPTEWSNPGPPRARYLGAGWTAAAAILFGVPLIWWRATGHFDLIISGVFFGGAALVLLLAGVLHGLGVKVFVDRPHALVAPPTFLGRAFARLIAGAFGLALILLVRSFLGK